MPHNAPKHVSLGEFTLAFVAMGLALIWALMAPELGGDLELGRTKLTIWATTFLLAPALVLYMFRSVGQHTANLAHLFWTAAWLVFVAHAYWAVFIIFDGVADTFRQQGTVIAGGNFLLLAWWTIDVVMLWLLPAHRQLMMSQIGVRVLAFLIFALTLVVLRGGAVQVLGFIFLGLLVAAAIVRLGTHERRAETMEA